MVLETLSYVSHCELQLTKRARSLRAEHHWQGRLEKGEELGRLPSATGAVQMGLPVQARFPWCPGLGHQVPSNANAVLMSPCWSAT